MTALMSLVLLILLLSPVLWGLWKLVRHVIMEFSGNTVVSVSSSTAYCRSCGDKGKPVKLIRGNLRYELLLWVLGVIPGVVYSFWRDNDNFVCSACGGKVLLD